MVLNRSARVIKAAATATAVSQWKMAILVL
jgi:hypothetical protein